MADKPRYIFRGYNDDGKPVYEYVLPDDDSGDDDSGNDDDDESASYSSETGMSAEDRRETEFDAISNMDRQLGDLPNYRPETTRKFVPSMTDEDLLWTIDADAGEIMDRAQYQPGDGSINPWWYS